MTRQYFHNNKPVSWLELRSLETGKSVEQIRAEMSQKAKDAAQARKDRGEKLGWAAWTPEQLREHALKGKRASDLAKKRRKLGSGAEG